MRARLITFWILAKHWMDPKRMQAPGWVMTAALSVIILFQTAESNRIREDMLQVQKGIASRQKGAIQDIQEIKELLSRDLTRRNRIEIKLDRIDQELKEVPHDR